MSLGLNRIEPASGEAAGIPYVEEARAAGTVRTMGIIALVLTGIGLVIPVLGFAMLIAAYLIAKRALKLSRDRLVPDEDERFARWASSISVVFLLFSAISIVLFILSAF